MTQIMIEQAMEAGLAHHRAGRLAEAEVIYRQVLAANPNSADALHLLGLLADQIGQTDAAIDLLNRAIKANPNSSEAHRNLGNILREHGRFHEAINLLGCAVQIQPGNAQAHCDLGVALRQMGFLDDAIAEFKKGGELNHFQSFNNLGIALGERARFDEAINALGRAIQIQPQSAEAHCNLGIVLKDAGRFDEAVSAFGVAIGLRENLVEAHNNLGVTLNDQKRFDQAAAAFRRAIEIRPDYCEAHANLGNTYRDQGRPDLAVESYRKALKIKPHIVGAHSGLIFAMHFHPEIEAKEILQESRNWSMQHERTRAGPVQPFLSVRSPDRRLRIGYVSPDFRTHPVGRFFLPLLANHNSENVEVFCYSGVKRPDAVTDKIKTLAHEWRNTIGLSEPDFAGQIREDKIDILVDLSLHTAGNRLLTFARKPAPLQLTWLGYPGTTGMAAMDYRFSDPYLDQPEADDYSEKTIQLPRTFYCCDPPNDSPPVGPLPAAESGFITFGSLNNFAKVNAATIELWIKVLRAVENSKLLIKSDPGSHVEDAKKAFEWGGIAADRIQFIDRVRSNEYLPLFNRIDIALDPIPYSGHATTVDGLWMGVPCITLAGRTAVGRGGVTILSNLGLTDWIAKNPGQYVAIAMQMAENLANLADLRAGLREKMLASPLMDGPQFAKDVESAYRQIWQTWCASKP